LSAKGVRKKRFIRVGRPQLKEIVNGNDSKPKQQRIVGEGGECEKQKKKTRKRKLRSAGGKRTPNYKKETKTLGGLFRENGKKKR